jgi:hypothetical protein
MAAYSHVRLGVSGLMRVYLTACSGVCLRVPCELVWERTVKQARSAPLSGIGSVIDSMPGSVLESVLRAYLGTYHQEG